MKTKLLTDVELRANWSRCRGSTYEIEPGTILTPAAKDFVREHQIELCTCVPYRKMPMTPVPQQGGKAIYVDASTGAELGEKPEELTHLHGNLLVPKNHPRIRFRGMLDSLSAKMLETEVLCDELSQPLLLQELEELRVYVMQILSAEVREAPLEELHLLGMDSVQIRYASHHVKETLGIDHPFANYQMGKLCVALNRLRTDVRETELCAADVFMNGEICTRADILTALNRLSSCVYLLFCRKFAGYYDRRS